MHHSTGCKNMAPKSTSSKPAKGLGVKKTPTERGKAHEKKLKKAAKKNKTFDDLDSDSDDSSEDDDADEAESKSGDKTLALDWSDPALSQALISCIMQDRDIKRALYPPPGPNALTARGGGKTKTSSQWQLCLNLLRDDPKYNEALASVMTTKERTAYTKKIKNHLRTMAKITCQYMDEMGQTSAGIRSADEINMSVTNSFTTRWEQVLMHPTAKISSTCPWFFDMSELIAQCSNLILTGLRHSGSEFDDDVLSTGPAPPTYELDPAVEEVIVHDDISSDEEELDCDTPFDTHSTSDDFPPTHELTALLGSDDNYRPSKDVGHSVQGEEVEDGDDSEGRKKKKAKHAGKTVAQPATSNPTPAPIPTAAAKPSKKTKVAEFAEITKTKELTRQKELDLVTIKARQSLKVLDVKSHLAEQREERRQEERQARCKERREKLKIKQMRLQHAHKLHMAQLTSSHAAGFSDPGLYAGLPTYEVSSSSYARSEPDHGDFGSFSAGPSSATSFETDYCLPPPNYD
ncbi:hypothetical protein B0H10DRAFT_1944944 [Mycena sp. CBHHK59/15]|nr:hypothetical protein B0H10DRAFT_1944944 [Mycena sp. CBHHK59/15]